LYWMTGKVWEWCGGWLTKEFTAAEVRDPVGAA
jgi:hypothetical protein